MKSSKAGSRKTASTLPESIHQHLNMYAIAAGAAGVSVLALAQPSEAKIVYTPADVVIQHEHYAIDLNHDGISDVVIGQECRGTTIFFGCYLDAKGKGIEVGTQGRGGAAALKAGANIGNTKLFKPHVDMAFCEGRPVCKTNVGYWHYAQARYLGVEFQISGKTHFGWARFKNSSARGATLTGYAYETVPGKSIIAGKTHGPADEWDKEDIGSGAFLTNPIQDTPQPPSLGILALGAQGVPLWRRKETQELIGQ
jgi:hypothetical protein